MALKIFLDDKGFDCLKRSIPAGSPSKFVVEQAVHLNFFGRNTVISCDEAEARKLLLTRSIARPQPSQYTKLLFRPEYRSLDPPYDMISTIVFATVVFLFSSTQRP